MIGSFWADQLVVRSLGDRGFAGTPGAANCHGQSVSVLSQTYGDSLANAAAALGYASVKDLQAAITAFCGG